MNNQSKKPYKGLEPYQEQDQDNFFGREADKWILVDKILTHKLTFLFAASGVGKSSLLQAAVIPELKRPSTAIHKPLDVLYYREWVESPIESLKEAILTELRKQGRIGPSYTLRENLPLVEFLQFCAVFTSDPWVIILDQFEEFFNNLRYHKEFPRFIEELADAIYDSQTSTAFVIAMREDFALELDAFIDTRINF